MTDKLNKVYEVKTGPGASLGLHLVIAYCDAPTFTLEDTDGKQKNWREDLCKEATQEQEVQYWKERAYTAEMRRKFRELSPEEQNAAMMKGARHDA